MHFDGLSQGFDMLGGGTFRDSLHLSLDVLGDFIDFRAEQILRSADNSLVGDLHFAVLIHGHSIHTIQPLRVNFPALLLCRG
jgi:hypothetical protein